MTPVILLFLSHFVFSLAVFGCVSHFWELWNQELRMSHCSQPKLEFCCLPVTPLCGVLSPDWMKRTGYQTKISLLTAVDGLGDPM